MSDLPQLAASSVPRGGSSLQGIWAKVGRRRLRAGGMVVLSFALGFGIWTFLSHVVFDPMLLPPPVEVGKTLWPMLKSGELWDDARASLVRIGVGFGLGSVVGVALGVLMGRIRIFRELTDPVVELLRYTSPTAMISIAIIWFGIGESSKYFLVFWGVVFIVLVNTWEGVRQTPTIRERAGRSLGARDIGILLHIVVPGCVPYILAGLRIALASGFVSVIPAEMLAARSGLGYLLQQSSLFGQTNRIFVALVTITALGFASDSLLRWLGGTALRRYTRYSNA